LSSTIVPQQQQQQQHKATRIMHVWKLTIIKLSQSIKERQGCLVVVKLLILGNVCIIKENVNQI
jgi:hypothetical protein